MPIVNMTDIHLAGKRVLIREDWNVPIKNGVVTSDARLRASLPTLALAQQAGASIMVMSHLGRPKEGQYDAILAFWKRGIENELCAVQAPALILHGDDDQIIPSANAALLAAALGNVRHTVILTGQGHMFWEEDMKLCVSHLSRFTSEVDGLTAVARL